MITWVLLASLCSLTVAQQCTFVNGDIIARWQVINGGLTVEMTNNNIGNNQWTGVGFGTDMSNLEVVLVQIRNNRPSLVTGFTQGYGSPTIDSTPNVVVQSLNYNSNTLVVRFTRPVGPTGSRGVSLQDCMTWNYVEHGDLEDGEIGYHTTPPTAVYTCAEECKKKLF